MVNKPTQVSRVQLCNTSSAHCITLEQQLPTSALQGFVRHAVADYLVRDTDLFSLRQPDKKMTTANTTIATWCERIKIIPIFCRISKKYK